MGDGFGALLVYTTAIYLGFAPDQIGIFGKNLIPTSTYQQFAWNLGQTVLRSESESHFLPADWPTFSQLDAWSRKDPGVMFRSAFRKFNPAVPDIMAEAQIVAQELGWQERIIGGTHVGWVVREPGPPAHFSIYDEDAQLLGRAKHVMLAMGHGPLEEFLAAYETLKKEIDPREEMEALKKELAQERLRNKLLTAMIDIAEEQLKIPIRKKSGTKRLKK